MLGLFLFTCAVPPPPAPPMADLPLVEDSGWGVIGHSAQGRPIRQRTVGHGPHVALWIGGIHGDEPEGSVATEALPAAFAADPQRGERITLHLIEDLNPDGRAAAKRGNANGVDLNRNFPTAFAAAGHHGEAPLDQPEAALLAAQIDALAPAVVLVAHSWRERRFINYDGPAQGIAEQFGRLSGYPVVVSEEIAPTPGSLGSWLGHSLGIPILTIEYERGSDPAGCWSQTRDAVLSSLEP